MITQRANGAPLDTWLEIKSKGGEMSQTIWKFPLEMTDRVGIMMPRNAEILSVQTQNGQPCLWVLVPNRDAEKERRVFRIYGTGHSIDEPGKFIGTFQLMDGALVFHVFEIAT